MFGVTNTVGAFSSSSVLKKVYSDADISIPFAAYEFAPIDLHLAIPAKIDILYFDVDNDGLVEWSDGTESTVKSEDLKIWYYNGFEWRNVGGALNKVDHTVSIYIDHLGLYALFAQNPMLASDYRPKEKIITPASIDDINDFAGFDGLNGYNFSIKIYDITGRNIRTISSPDMPKWDGKDESGNIVESGAYIYQFKAVVDGKDKLISGTIIIAK